MSFESWRGAVVAIDHLLAPATAEHHALAAVAGIHLRPETPHLVAAAQLRLALQRHLHLRRIRHWNSEGQDTYVAELAARAGAPVPHYDTAEEGEAWIQVLHLQLRREALEQLRLSRGDIVQVVAETTEQRYEEVSSIGEDGAVYFKGNARAWPDQLTVHVQKGDTSGAALVLRQKAANNAAHRRRLSEWSTVKQRLLSPYHVPNDVQQYEVDELRKVLDTAKDEKPLQQFFQQHPQILASVMRGPNRFVIPQVRVGTSYVADFYLADVDSTGVRWVLVELETPKSAVSLSSSNEFDKHARKGISQIKEWREWLQRNLDEAQRPLAEHGLGLIDIRPRAEGYVLVGRRDSLGDRARDLRLQLWETDLIRVETYDRLVERLEGVLGGRPPSGVDMNLLERPNALTGLVDDEDEDEGWP